MVKALQNLGDRLVGRIVPEVVAEAGVQDYIVVCSCILGIRHVKACVAGKCGRCYESGTCSG